MALRNVIAMDSSHIFPYESNVFQLNGFVEGFFLGIQWARLQATQIDSDENFHRFVVERRGECVEVLVRCVIGNGI